jgi:hypothetical protein
MTTTTTTTAETSNPSGSKKTDQQTTTKKDEIPLSKDTITAIASGDFDEATFDKFRGIMGKIYEYLSPEEQEYYKNKRLDEQKKQDARKAKFDKDVELAAAQEMFEIPRGSGNHYAFIGYDSEQYVKINELANKADAIVKEKRGTKEYLEMEVQTYKLMILYSLQNITEEAIKKIPLRELAWYFNVLKKKNEEPLPFGQSA